MVIWGTRQACLTNPFTSEFYLEAAGMYRESETKRRVPKMRPQSEWIVIE
jgi:hypothetical protein